MLSDLKGRARGALCGHWGNAVLIFFAAQAVTWLMSLILRYAAYYVGVLFILISSPESAASFFAAGSVFSADSIFSAAAMLTEIIAPYQTALDIAEYCADLISQLFTGILTAGTCLFCLNLCCGRRARLSDLFFGYHYQFGKSLLLSFVSLILAQLYVVPSELMLHAWSNGGDHFTLYTLLTICGFALYAFLFLFIAMSWYLLLDFPKKSAPALLRLSARVIRGQKRLLFLLYLSFVPLEFLNLCTFGVAGLWITPYLRMTESEFFLNMMVKREYYAKNH